MVKLEVTTYDAPPKYIPTSFAGLGAGLLMDFLWFAFISRWIQVYKSYNDEEEGCTFVRVGTGIVVVGIISAFFGAVVVTDTVSEAIIIGALIGFYVSGTYNFLTMARTSGRYTLLMAIVDTVYGMVNLIVVYLVQHWVQH
jgi:uncharacterized membrane protein